MARQDHSKSGTQRTALVPVTVFPVLCATEQKIVVNPKLTIIPLETLGVHSPSQPDHVWILCWDIRWPNP